MGFLELLASADAKVRGVLGGTVTYSPGSGDPVDVDGIFDAAHVSVEVNSNPAAVNSVGPAVFLTLTDLPTDPETDTTATVTVDGTDYEIREVHPDGLGGVYLLLTEA